MEGMTGGHGSIYRSFGLRMSYILRYLKSERQTNRQIDFIGWIKDPKIEKFTVPCAISKIISFGVKRELKKQARMDPPKHYYEDPPKKNTIL